MYISLYIKYPIPANNCSIRATQSTITGSLITRMASQTLHDQCTEIPGNTSQNSNCKMTGKK